MKYTLTINQKEIIESGITGVDAIDMLVFDVAMNAIQFGDLDEPEIIDGKAFQWVSYNLLIQELPLLNLSKAAMKRRVANLVAAGLIVKSSANEDQRKLFMALTPLAKKLFTDIPHRFKNEPGGGVTNEQTPGSQMNRNKNTSNNGTINHTTPPTPLDGGSVEPPARLKKIKVKKRCTDDEAMEFYKDQLKDFPLPPEGGAVAPGPEVAYRMLVRWMFASGTGLKNGFRGTVLNMADQLAYDEYISLIKESGMSDYQLRQYLVRMHNWEERHKNKSIYWVIKKWYRDDLAAGKTPPRSESAANEPERKVAKIVQRGPIGD